MTLAAVLARGRAAAERRMVDTCTIRRAGTTIYTGRCEVVQDDGGEAADDADTFAVNTGTRLRLPVSLTGLELGDEATIDASPRDPDLVGTVYRIQGIARETNATARRVMVTERDGGVYLRNGDDRDWTT